MKNMKKNRAYELGFILSIVIFTSAFCVPALTAAMTTPALTVTKRLRCPTGPGFSDNSPWYVGQKYYYWLEIEIYAYEDLKGVILYDRLGAEFMLEAIHDDYLPPGLGIISNCEYIFTYDGGEPVKDGGVTADGFPGTVNKIGIPIYNSLIFWTGKSCKVHIEWHIGDIDADQTVYVYLVISTDENPAGWQEFTSPGCVFLNSGATVKARVNGKQVSAESNGIGIQVLPAI